MRKEAHAAQVPSFELEVQVRCAQPALRAGEAQRAATSARAALELFADTEPNGMYRAEIWLAAVHALRCEDAWLADRTLHTAVDWIEDTAARHVPREFRDSFLSHNSVNRALLTMATRQLKGNNAPQLPHSRR